MLTAARLTIDELTIPPTTDDPSAAGFVEMVRVRNGIQAQLLGSAALACTPEELLPVYQAQEFAPKRLFVARVDDAIVGRAILDWSIAVNTSSSWVTVEVRPEFRGRGIGAGLLGTVESIALESGRPVLQSEVVHTWSPGGERLPSPTGFGDLSMNDPGVRFLLGRGYHLEQIERISFLDLPADRSLLRRQLRSAVTAAGEQYSLVSWTGWTPPERVLDLARLRTRMSVDAPAGGMDVTEEPWDEARVANDDDTANAGGQTRLTVAVEHRPTGTLVGFTELYVPADPTRPTRQGDTLVLAEHRGHRLGMLLKVANLLELGTIESGPPFVYTFNAEENRHMLNVNEAIGFRGVGQAGCWRKGS